MYDPQATQLQLEGGTGKEKVGWGRGGKGRGINIFLDSFSLPPSPPPSLSNECQEQLIGPSQPLPCFCLHLGTRLTKLLERSAKKYLITKRNSQADCRMVYEARKQSMAWMETDYSKHMHFRWKIKWRLEWVRQELWVRRWSSRWEELQCKWHFLETAYFTFVLQVATPRHLTCSQKRQEYK